MRQVKDTYHFGIQWFDRSRGRRAVSHGRRSGHNRGCRAWYDGRAAELTLYLNNERMLSQRHQTHLLIYSPTRDLKLPLQISKVFSWSSSIWGECVALMVSFKAQDLPLSIDNTLLQLPVDLLSKGTHCTGTVNINRTIFPTESIPEIMMKQESFHFTIAESPKECVLAWL